MIKSVKYFVKKQVELKKQGTELMIGTNPILDVEKEIDIITIQYKITNNELMLEEINLVQVKTGRESDEKINNIATMHRNFLKDLVGIRITESDSEKK